MNNYGIGSACFLILMFAGLVFSHENSSRTLSLVPVADAGSPDLPEGPVCNGPGDTLRVFTYNIQHGRGMDGEVNIGRIAEVIGSKNPHLVALNEVDVGVERSGNIDIMALLAEYLDMSPVFGKNIPHQGGEYGNGFLSSFPILSSGNLHFTQPESGEQRGLLHIVVDVNGAPLVLMNTHLDHQSEENRLKAVEQIVEEKKRWPGLPVILTGDLNAVPGSAPHANVIEHFTDVWEIRGEGDGFTIPPDNPGRRIDYIFYSNRLSGEAGPCLRSVEMEVVDSDASDHLPIYAEFILVRRDTLNR